MSTLAWIGWTWTALAVGFLAGVAGVIARDMWRHRREREAP